ncbi:hypothetical protein C7974DRAFT_163624 [Boeremia exigua]|uniref:uncharacterized protein n=1 Tax=Boeremia exigua TaxID=749465 RepID=UPI001E8CB107|nr:uncharacterized protein C7974DRAFT_163624 [Boeremia exigua]KAH6633035.1 hypothetical protein C7974DRAFT_163624 [Boeremia exigua]
MASSTSAELSGKTCEKLNAHVEDDNMLKAEAELYEYSVVRLRGFALPKKFKGLTGSATELTEDTVDPKAPGTRRRPVIIKDSEEECLNQDFLAQLNLVWTGAQALLAEDLAAQTWVDARKGLMSMFTDGQDIIDRFDRRRLSFLHPRTVAHLLLKGTKIQIAQYFPLCEDLVAIKRFMGSRLPRRFGSDETSNMRESIKPYVISTIDCRFRANEMPAHQALRREASTRFFRTGIKSQKASNAAAAFGGTKGSLIYPVAEMRELLITAMSRFMCEQQHLALPTNATGYMEAICEGSPLLRGLIQYVTKNDRFLKPRKNGKFLVAEEVPLNALFLEWGLNMLGIETAVFHSGLTQKERNDLQDEFNNPGSSLTCVIIFYNVGGVGINLWKDCHTVFLATPAANEANEKQAYGRVIRAPQPFIAHIYKFYVEQSIFAYRESRKRDKYLVKLATRASDPAMRSLIVKCLNLHQENVRADPTNISWKRGSSGSDEQAHHGTSA